MTEKNILQNWFVTGAKPTQEQFWAWQESYWHKGESIPTEKILGLSEVLANKADVEMLQHKANLDSSNLTGEHVLAWKEKLGVGELPSNIATIDEGNKQGNTYTKTKVNELLENSGKNIANTDLQIPAGTVRTLDVTGAKLNIKGLREVTSDNSYTKKLRMNNLGEVVSTTESDFTINVPDTINIQSRDITYANTLTSINKVKLFGGIVENVAVKQPKTLYEKYMQTITENLYTRITDTSEWTKVYNEGFDNLIEWDNVSKLIKYNRSPDPNFKRELTNFGMVLNKPFPMNKNWVFSFKTTALNTNIQNTHSSLPLIGFLRGLNGKVTAPQIGIITGSDDGGSTGFKVTNVGRNLSNNDIMDIIYIKIDKVIYIHINTLYGVQYTFSFDISNITEENIYFTVVGAGTRSEYYGNLPKMFDFKYYIDDRNIDLTERVDNEQNLQKIKEFKQRISAKNLVALQGSDWAIDKVIEDGGNNSIIRNNLVELHKNIKGFSDLTKICSLAYTPNFKLPRNKNYYFKFQGSINPIRAYYSGTAAIGFINSNKGIPNFGVISSGQDNPNSGMNVGTVMSDNVLAPIHVKYSPTTFEIWKVDNLVNIRLTQGIDEIYNVIFDIDLCGDLRPASSYQVGNDNRDITLTHTFGEYYIETLEA